MQCDQCRSDNTQKLQMVYENGKQNINTRSHSAGAGIGGSFGVGGVSTKTSGTSQSVLSEKVSPPTKKAYKFAVIGVILGAFFLSGNGALVAVGLLMIGLGAYFIYAAAKFNKNEWPSLYKHWQECWLCNKCGNIYHYA